MTAYENLLAVVYHGGPSVYGCQALRLKIIDMTPTGPTAFSTLKEMDCPISRGAILQWLGFSEEGQLYSYDTEGVFRGLSFRNY